MPSSRATDSVILAFTTLIIAVPLIVILALGYQKNLSCDKPLQMYLIVYALSIIPSFIVSSYRIAINKEDQPIITEIFRVILALFSVAWTIYGGCLIFTANNCLVEAPLYYYMTKILVVIPMAVLGIHMSLGLLALILCCVL